jgi:hypothetical protein
MEDDYSLTPSANSTPSANPTPAAANTAVTLNEIYTEVCRAPADQRVINAWGRAIDTGNKALKDFSDFLTGRMDYKLSVRRRYQQLATEVISSDAFNEEDFELFFADYMSQGQLIRDSDLAAHVRTLPQFRKKHEELVYRVAAILRDAAVSDSVGSVGSFSGPGVSTSEDAAKDNGSNEANEPRTPAKVSGEEDEFLQQCVDRFCADAALDVDSLHTQLNDYYTSRHPTAVLPSKNTSSGSGADRMTSMDVTGAPNSSPSREALGSADTPSSRADALARLSSYLQRFEGVYGRKMFVEEFVWYGAEGSVSDESELGRRRAAFMDAFQEARELYVAYIDADDFDEYEFVRLHLSEFEQPGFLAGLPGRLIATPQYSERMRAKLISLYSSFYDELLDEASNEYLFERVRRLRTGIHDEELPTHVRAFKDETDTFTDNIFFVYTTAFMRSPEDDELRGLVHEYRARLSGAESSNDMNITVMNDEIIVRLMGTLEFHDVLKGKLKVFAQSEHGVAMSPGQTYSLLQLLLIRLPKCRSMVDVDELVQRLACEHFQKN